MTDHRISKEGGELNFESRSQKLLKLKFPENTANCIIIPANKDGVGFQSKAYDELLLLNKIDKAAFDNTIQEATKICRNLWREKKREEVKDYTKEFQRVIYLSVFLILVAFLLIIVEIYASAEISVLYIAVAILCLAAVLTLTVAGKVWSMKPEFMDLEVVTMQKLTEYFQNPTNKAYYQGRGYTWFIEDNFQWLELRKQQ